MTAGAGADAEAETVGRQERRPISVLIPLPPFHRHRGHQPDYPFLSEHGQRLHHTPPSHIIIF